MNQKKLIQNIIDQIKEAQIKLGYAKETLRLYYPVSSLNALLGTECADAEEMAEMLNEDFAEGDVVLGQVRFAVSSGRIEVSVPPEGAEYVHENVKDTEFLIDLIGLFRDHHSCSIDQVCDVFRRYSSDFECKEMPEDTDFDYVVHFMEPGIDEYYYCIKMEMGHTIYHRFTKADYELLLV